MTHDARKHARIAARCPFCCRRYDESIPIWIIAAAIWGVLMTALWLVMVLTTG